jgi:hypothetical protein
VIEHRGRGQPYAGRRAELVPQPNGRQRVETQLGELAVRVDVGTRAVAEDGGRLGADQG